MLVLTRKIDQSIAVGGTESFEHLLKITVLSIGSGTVRLGFEVDSSVPIHRMEVWERIRSAAATDGHGEFVDVAIA